MHIETLQPVLETAHHLSGDWFEGDKLPLPSASSVPYQLAWRKTPRDIRKRLIVEAERIDDRRETVPALFVLWSWEPEYELRRQIVGALPLNDQPNIGDVLDKIFRHETGDEGGAEVRKTVKERLTELGSIEGRGRVRTRGAVRTRGPSPHRRSALEILSDLEELESLGPIRTR